MNANHTKNVLKQIIRDNWCRFQEKNRRYKTEYYDSVIKKMLGCGEEMEKEGQLIGPPSQWYNYKCVSYNYETEIEDIVVDAYFYSQGCKKGVYPTFTCPKCNKRMKYVGDQKSTPKVR